MRRRSGGRGLHRFLRPYRAPLALVVALILAETVLDLARPWPLKLAVDHAIGGQPLDGPLAPLRGWSPAGIAAVAAGGALLLVAVSALVGYITTYVSAAVAERVGADLRNAVFSRMLALSLGFHDRHRSGDLASRLTSDVARVEDGMIAWATTLLPEGLTLVGMVAVLLAVDVPLGLAALSVVPPLALVVAIRRRRVRELQRRSRDADALVTSHAVDVLRNVRVVQAFGREPAARSTFRGRGVAATRAALSAIDLEARTAPAADLLLAAGGALVLWLGVAAVVGGRMTLGTLLVVLSYLSSLYGPVRSLARLARTLARAAASRDRIQEVLASREEVPQPPAAVEAGPPRRGVALLGVTFTYPGGTAPALRDVSLEIRAGERVCLVGPTGAGKSTLLALLLRFYDPVAGRVELDGHDLRGFSLPSLRRQFALVPQDPWLLDGTIADNIAYGRPGAGDADVLRAARLALVDEFAERLPDGYDSQIGEGAVRLSGGQRRRVALARAVLRDAPVLLLDEPTSGLDAGSEALVAEALERTARGRTVITVSHRLNLAARADRVVVLDGGRVVEQGRPAELQERGGAFARLWALQRPETTVAVPAASPVAMFALDGKGV
jgi:ATP-binding cassette subfamily B protein